MRRAYDKGVMLDDGTKRADAVTAQYRIADLCVPLSGTEGSGEPRCHREAEGSEAIWPQHEP